MSNSADVPPNAVKICAVLWVKSNVCSPSLSLPTVLSSQSCKSAMVISGGRSSTIKSKLPKSLDTQPVSVFNILKYSLWGFVVLVYGPAVGILSITAAVLLS